VYKNSKIFVKDKSCTINTKKKETCCIAEANTKKTISKLRTNFFMVPW